jgi:amino acid transporter
MQIQQLQRNALTGFDSTLIAVSSASPANGFATNTLPLVVAVGMSGPGSLIFGAIPMFGIALAYFYLNSWRSDAGAAYSWVGRTINPTLGFLSGWSLLVAIVLFMVVGSLPLGSTTLHLFAPKYETSVLAVTGVGLVWFVIVVGIVLLGIKATAEVQKALTLIQIGGLVVFIGFAFAKGLPNPVNHLGWSWFGPVGNHGLQSFWEGALVSIFYFWGWDISSNLTEETKNRNRIPGVSGIAGMVIILALFVMSQTAVQLIMSPQAIAAASSNLLVAFVDAAMPKQWDFVGYVVILIATIAVLEVSLVQGARTMFSMGRDRVLDERFAHLNSRYLTPWNATIVLSAVTVALFALAATSTSVNQILNDTIKAIAVMIAIYYGLSGFACARYYRVSNRVEKGMWWLRCAWPVASALFVFAVAAWQLAIAGFRSDTAVIGLLLLGFVPMFLYKRHYNSTYYTEAMEYERTVDIKSTATQPST